MKICIVCPRLCHGGAERVAVSLANGFVGRGHDVMFFADLYEEQTFVLHDAVKLQNLVPQTNNKFIKWVGGIRLLRTNVKSAGCKSVWMRTGSRKSLSKSEALPPNRSIWKEPLRPCSKQGEKLFTMAYSSKHIVALAEPAGNIFWGGIHFLSMAESCSIRMGLGR